MNTIARISNALALAGVFFLFEGLLVGAAPQSSSGPATEPKHQMTDAQFAKSAARGGTAEVKLGELATQKGDNTTVKDFGKRMITDHTAANKKLDEIASKDGMSLPSGLSQQDQALYDQLSKLSGGAFDRAYARAMVKDHEKDIAEFKREASSGNNDDVKNFASQTLPTLEEHFRLAQNMLRSVTEGTASGGQLKPTK
jgi:putative membrane protein